MRPNVVEHIANIASLLDEPLQEKLWEYAELLYVEQVAFDSAEPGVWTIGTTHESEIFAR